MSSNLVFEDLEVETSFTVFISPIPGNVGDHLTHLGVREKPGDQERTGQHLPLTRQLVQVDLVVELPSLGFVTFCNISSVKNVLALKKNGYLVELV